MQSSNIREAYFYSLDIGRKLNINTMFQTSSQSLVYVQFMSCSLGVIFKEEGSQETGSHIPSLYLQKQKIPNNQ